MRSTLFSSMGLDAVTTAFSNVVLLAASVRALRSNALPVFWKHSELLKRKAPAPECHFHTEFGRSIEQVVAIPVSSLPAGVATYVKAHYPGVKITEAGKVTDAQGKTKYEAEMKGKDLVFDENGNFIKVD